MLKRVFGVLILTLVWSVSSGQRQSIKPYGNYNPDEVKSFALGNSAKAKQFAEDILRRTGEENIDSLFKKVYIVKDTLLKAGTYDNSYWDVPSQKIVYFSGKEFSGEVSVYKNRIFETVLYKDTCVNALVTRKKYFGLIDEDQPNVVVDSTKTVSGTTIINNTTNVNNYYTKKDTTLNESLNHLGTQKDTTKTFFETTVGKVLLTSALATLTGVGIKYLFFNEKEKPIIIVQPPVVIPPIVIPPVVIPPIVIPPVVIPPVVIPPVIVPPVEPRTQPDGIPSEPTTMPDGIPAVTPETPVPTTNPDVPVPPAGLPAEPRGMPGGIGQTFFPAGRMITVGIRIPAPWGR